LNRTLEQALLIARFDLGTAIKTKRAILGIVVYIGLALLGSVIYCSARDKISAILDERIAESGIDQQIQVPKNVTEKDLVKAFCETPLGAGEKAKPLGCDPDVPLVLLIFFLLITSLMPLLIAVISSDILNREIRSRAARFILLRSSRTSFVLGKAMSHGLLFLVAAILSWAVFMTYITINLKGFDLVANMPHVLLLIGLTLIFGFCYLGLTALISSLVDGAGVAVLVTIAALIGLGVVGGWDFGGWLSPSWYRYRLWSPYTIVVLSGIAAYIGFGLVFFTAAWARTVRRDV